MIDLNHGSGCKPGALPPVQAMLDLIDQGILAKAAEQEPRAYLGGSRLGVACLRSLQFEYTHTPPDEGRDFDARLHRIFQRGHAGEEMVIGWLRGAGFDLRTERRDGEQYGFTTAGGRIAGHIDGVIVGMLNASICPIQVPALWECKFLNDKSWNDTVKKGVTVSKPVYAAQMATYQAYMDLTAAPAVFTAVNANTMELYLEVVPFDAALAQRSTDRGVQVIESTEAGILLPRIARSRDFFECRFCKWQDRCWSLPS